MLSFPSSGRTRRGNSHSVDAQTDQRSQRLENRARRRRYGGLLSREFQGRRRADETIMGWSLIVPIILADKRQNDLRSYDRRRRRIVDPSSRRRSEKEIRLRPRSGQGSEKNGFFAKV